MPPETDQQDAGGSQDQLAQEDINDLAGIIASEARGLNETARAMVGWTVVNRMQQRHMTEVSPTSMPKEGETPSFQADVRGGLESVSGVTKNGRQVRNYFPGWAKRYSSTRIPGIQDKDLKFYRVP